jgi:TBC1 domain family member 5
MYDISIPNHKPLPADYVTHGVIPSDYSSQLTYLLRYPSLPPFTAPDLPHHATLLLRQAVALQMSPNPSAGASIVVENRNLLGIPVEVPDPPPAPTRRRGRPDERSHQISASDGSGVDPSGGRSGLRQSSYQMGLPESIARGLLDRGESMGINKTFLTAVSELRVSFLYLWSFRAQYGDLSFSA